ncbi:MAG: alkaline phosphatase family protein [Flavobacteriaceae bacterium]|nr:alkaline phosphatase family protein [Flavobacteriaceae bacterium]
MKKEHLFILLFIFFTACVAQTNIVNPKENSITKSVNKKPRLVIGIVIDQMRYDYLTRFYDKYSENGFKRLMNDGFSCENAHFNYIPTYTAVGHASIYTGTTPQHHGIIGNSWYDKFLKKSIYCVDDDNYETVGAKKGGKKSPYRLFSTTITDELYLSQNKKGKVIGVSIKDRSAIFPAGHTANAAYWYQGKDDGKFITSSFYKDTLPDWVVDFNNSGKISGYLNQTWNTLYDINLYTESIEDNNTFEGLFKGKKTPTFPYNLSELKTNNGNFDLLKRVPYGNTIVKDFAETAIIAEQLGQDNFTDFLAISFSSTDYIGHQFGIDSKEIEDTYLRLDKDLASFFNFLDKKVGKGNYTLFLTADHAAVQVPSYLQSLKIPAGYFDEKELKKLVNEVTLNYFKSDSLVENISNFQLFLNKRKIKELHLDTYKVVKTIADEIINFNGVYKVVTAQTLQTTNFTRGVLRLLQNGYNQKLSGDILIVPNPSTIVWKERTGTTHGSGYNYDTHVPLLFYGKGIKKGKSKRYIPIIDIAPTLANLLQISFPNANTGKIIEEVFED